MLSLAANLGIKAGPLHLRWAILLSLAANLGTKAGPLHLRWANFLSLAASRGFSRKKNAEKPSIFTSFSATAPAYLDPAQRISHHTQPYPSPSTTKNFGQIGPQGAEQLAAPLGFPGQNQRKSPVFDRFFSVFWPPPPRSSTQPNEICIIRSHTLARLPRKISAQSAHRGPSNGPRRGANSDILGC